MALERRRHVRVHPTADYDLRVELTLDGITHLLQVVNVGLGGIGLLIEGPVAERKVGDSLRLVIALPSGMRFRADAELQHMSRGKGVCGAKLLGLDEPSATALGRYVSELLVRGAPG
jgi:hypothetical protein